MNRKLILGLLAIMVLFVQSTLAAEPAESARPKIGYVGVTWGFNPVKKNSDGEFLYVKGLKEVQARSGNVVEVIQVPLFPDNLTEKGLPETKKLFSELREHVGTVVPILMLTEDPLDREKKKTVVDMLTTLLIGCDELGMTECSGTFYEAWMKGTMNKAKPLTGKAFDEACEHLVEVLTLAITNARKKGCKVNHLDMEYLRDIEYTTFTDAEKAWRVVDGINKKLRFVFVRFLDDSAHAGNSGISVERINAVRRKASKAGAHGIFHVSEPTTRGRIGSSGPYALNALRDALKNGNPPYVLVEVFDPSLPDTQLMKDNIPGYGKMTFTDSVEVVVHGLTQVQKVLDEIYGE